MGDLSNLRRVLVVDDNRDVADMVAEVLSMHGYRACAVYSGEEGLSAIAEFEPDVVFLDLCMPGINGFEVAQTVRDWDCRKPALIAFSSMDDTAVLSRVEELGFSRHLLKTGEFDALLGALDTLP